MLQLSPLTVVAYLLFTGVGLSTEKDHQWHSGERDQEGDTWVEAGRRSHLLSRKTRAVMPEDTSSLLQRSVPSMASHTCRSRGREHLWLRTPP